MIQEVFLYGRLQLQRYCRFEVQYLRQGMQELFFEYRRPSQLLHQKPLLLLDVSECPFCLQIYFLVEIMSFG